MMSRGLFFRKRIKKSSHKRGFFERVVDAFKKKERERFIVAGSSKFHEELDMTIGKEEDKK